MNEIIVCRDCVSSDCTGCNMLVLYHALERNRFEALMNENRHLNIDTDVVPVRHGRWIEKRWSTEDDWGVINWHSLTCSACGHEERTNGLSPNSIYKYDYCPHCGAKMDKDSDRDG